MRGLGNWLRGRARLLLAFAATGGLLLSGSAAAGGEKEVLQEALEKTLLRQGEPMAELQSFLETRFPKIKEVKTLPEWEVEAARLREEVLAKVVFRGAAAAWRDAELGLEWQETIEGGPGYRIKKLRFEAVPKLWVPALLYEPLDMAERVPVVLNVNGHDSKGKAADYKQIRCINLAKRGVLAMNVEWLGMGQLKDPGFEHGLINAIDLCGTGGIATHFLLQKRALDVLLAHEKADPTRVGVTGLSGGGWQTIFFSALEPRVTLSSPVAGYSAFPTRIRHLSDLGDSEQTPCDLATVADYSHFTAMLAPRPSLLMFNAKDNCCFAAPHAMPPLLEAAAPIFSLFDQEARLRVHVNIEPGDHNYGLDNRQAFYRMVRDYWFHGDDSLFHAAEIPSETEVKTAEQLNLSLPPDNSSLQGLALSLIEELPRVPQIPEEEANLTSWREQRLAQLRGVVKLWQGGVHAEEVSQEERDGLKLVHWRFRVGESFTVPALEVTKGEGTNGTAILLADEGRKALAEAIIEHLQAGRRVLAIDPLYVGESVKIERDYLWMLLVGTIGERPLGIQAGQVASIARWAQKSWGDKPVELEAKGQRTSLSCLVAAALEPAAIAGLRLREPLGSLKEVVRSRTVFSQAPELFCFGLLEFFDLDGIAALIAPRPVNLISGSEEAKKVYGAVSLWRDSLTVGQ